LPALNKALLATVLEHASEIVDHSASNKMGVDALARTLGSNISRSSETDGVAEMLLSHKLFAALLTSWRSASAQSPPRSDAPKGDTPVLTAPLLPARLSSAQAMTLIQHTEPAAAPLTERAAPALMIDTAAAAVPVAAAAAPVAAAPAAVASPRAGGTRAQPVSVGDRVRAPLTPADRSNSSRHAEGTVTRMRLDGSCDVVFNSGAIALAVPRESVIILQSAAAAGSSKSQSPKSKSPGLGSTLRDVVHKFSDPVGLLFNNTTTTSTSQPGSPRSSSPSRLAATVSLASAAGKAQSPTDAPKTIDSSGSGGVSVRLSRPLSLPHSRSKEAATAATGDEQQAVSRAKAVSLSPSSRLSLPSPRSTAHAHNANSSSSTTVSSVLSKLQAAATSPRSALLRQTAQLNGSSEEPHTSTGGFTSTAYATSSGTVDAMTAVVRQTLLDRAAQQTLHYSAVRYKSAYAAAAAGNSEVPAVESDYHDADFAATGLSRSPSRSPERSATTATTANSTTFGTGIAAGGSSVPYSGVASGSKRSPTATANGTAATGTTGSSKSQQAFSRVPAAADGQYNSTAVAAVSSSEEGKRVASILAQAQASMAAERVQLHRQIYSLQADVSAEAAARAVCESTLAAVQAQAAAAAAQAQAQQQELQHKLAAAEAQLTAVTRHNERSDAVDRETQSVLLVQDRLIKSLQVSFSSRIHCVYYFTALHVLAIKHCDSAYPCW
jgi:hypothetical protein